MTASLFEKYGGFPQVRKIVSDFYDMALEDGLLRHHFRAVDMRQLVDHQTKMVSALLGGPSFLSNEQLARAHDRLEITQAEFDRLGEIMDKTLSVHQVASEDRRVVLGQIEAMRSYIVEGIA